MWKCKKCGGTDIIGHVNGLFRGSGKINDDALVEEIDVFEVTDHSVIYYSCDDCNCSGPDIRDIADRVDD